MSYIDEMGKPLRIITLRWLGFATSAFDVGEGPLVLCLHGFPDNKNSFRFQLERLALAGFRVVAPNLRGYEVSSKSVDDDYSLISLASDVFEWQDQLGVKSCFIVGHDWGAVVGYAASVMNPQRVKSLITLAVPPLQRLELALLYCPQQLLNSWYMLFFQLIKVSDYFVQRNDHAFVETLWRSWSPGWDFDIDTISSVKATLGQPGVTRAALSYYRCLFAIHSRQCRDSWSILRKDIEVPLLALTGELDGCINTRLYDCIIDKTKFPQGVKTVRVPDCGHFLHQEKPGIVTDHILKWLRGQR